MSDLKRARTYSARVIRHRSSIYAVGYMFLAWIIAIKIGVVFYGGWMVSKFDSRYPILQQQKSKDDFES